MFTDLIEQRVTEKGIEVAQMLKDLELGQGTFSTWNKRGFIPSGKIVSKISDYFGVTTDYPMKHSRKPMSMCCTTSRMGIITTTNCIRLRE